jgi:DNA-damage-inducible protein J
MSKTATRSRARADDVVRVRIDAATKAKATAVLEEIGMTPSDAVRLLLRKIAHEEALPFAPLTPNKATRAALKEAGGRLKKFKSVDDLMADLTSDTETR